MKKPIPCISEGKTTKKCSYKAVKTTASKITQECRHCGKIRSVLRRKRQ